MRRKIPIDWLLSPTQTAVIVGMVIEGEISWASSRVLAATVIENNVKHLLNAGLVR